MKSDDNFRSLLLLLMKTFVLEGKYYIIFVIQVIVYTVYTVLIKYITYINSHTDYGSLTKKKLMDCDGLEIQHPFTKVVTTYKFRTYLIRFNGIFGQWVYLNQQNIVLHIPN